MLILQHPEEASQAKNTGLLLSRCLTRVQLQVGDIVPPVADSADTAGMVLLYPDLTTDASQPAPTPWPAEGVHTLVVLDATWRKSRRMIHQNPWLARLPRLSLTATPPSRYAIRRAHDVDQRSTLEACALALAQLDGLHPDRYEPLWAAMDAFVQLQQQLAREGRARRDARTSASG